MLTLIEEELMIVGVSSFTFKILSNTYIDFSNNTWYYPLEFGELLIPILAFSYCMMGIILIITSLSQVYRWNRAHHMRVVEILDDYFQLSGTIMFRITWKPLHGIINEMEFKIFHDIFCKKFNIQKDVFAFDEYVIKVFERFVKRLVSIRWQDWCFVCVLVLLNLLRKTIRLEYHHCNSYDFKCSEENDHYLFLFTGICILGVTCFYVVMSRYFEKKILVHHELYSHLDYPYYLQSIDTASSKKSDSRRLTLGGLKVC